MTTNTCIDLQAANKVNLHIQRLLGDKLPENILWVVSPKTFPECALSMPNGVVILSPDLLTNYDEETVMAIYLHEMGHIELGHSVYKITVEANLITATSLTLAMIRLSRLSLYLACFPGPLYTIYTRIKMEFEADNWAISHGANKTKLINFLSSIENPGHKIFNVPRIISMKKGL